MGNVVELKGLTMQQAVEMLAYEYPEGAGYMQRVPTMTNGPRWEWHKGRLMLREGVGAGLRPPRKLILSGAITSRDWMIRAVVSS